MKYPDQSQMDHWIEVALEGLTQTDEDFRSGFFEQNQISIQSVHTGTASLCASLGRAKYLNGDPIEEVRQQFTRSAGYVLKSFKMAYDESDPNYRGSDSDSSCINEGEFIDGMNYALMACDFDLAKELAFWFRDPPPKARFRQEINAYAHGLCEVVNGRFPEAEQRMAEQLAAYEKKPSKKRDARANFNTMSIALHGIASRDSAQFNQGLDMQLAFYKTIARGEFRDTPQAFICDYAVALANLGLHHGLEVTVEHGLLPGGLLVST